VVESTFDLVGSHGVVVVDVVGCQFHEINSTNRIDNLNEPRQRNQHPSNKGNQPTDRQTERPRDKNSRVKLPHQPTTHSGTSSPFIKRRPKFNCITQNTRLMIGQTTLPAAPLSTGTYSKREDQTYQYQLIVVLINTRKLIFSEQNISLHNHFCYGNATSSVCTFELLYLCQQ
jgi:hypothetical protein